MERHGSTAPFVITKLLVRAPLSYLGKSHALENSNNITGLEDRDIPHRLGHCDSLQPYELDFEFRLSVLQEHGDHFL